MPSPWTSMAASWPTSTGPPLNPLHVALRSKDNLFLNAELVRKGVAKRYKVAPNVKYDAKFVELEKEAKASRAGLWGACKGTASADVAGMEVNMEVDIA